MRHFSSKRHQQNGLIVRIQLLYELIQRLCTEREMERDQFRWDTTAVLSHMALVYSARSRHLLNLLGYNCCKTHFLKYISKLIK